MATWSCRPVRMVNSQLETSPGNLPRTLFSLPDGEGGIKQLAFIKRALCQLPSDDLHSNPEVFYKLPQTGDLKQCKQILSQFCKPKTRCLGGWFPLEAVRDNLFYACLSASVGCRQPWCSLAWAALLQSLPLLSPSGPSFLGVWISSLPLLSLIRTPVI